MQKGTSVGPIYRDYPDNGCNVSPRCLDCPLSACKYDAEAPYLAWLNSRPDSLHVQVARLRREGMTQSAIALRLGVSLRTVQRYDKLTLTSA